MNLNHTIQKPARGEFPDYASMYIDLLPADGKLLTHLWNNLQDAKRLVQSFPPHKHLYRYAEGKWTIKEILVHIIDDERIYGYRALRFARNDKTQLPGFDQDRFAFHSNANERTLEGIMEEYDAVRMSTITLFDSFTDDVLLRRGTANNNEVTVRALGYHIAGHELHHHNIIKTRYIK
ncbi:MAG TPA: DinB family protein [Chryseolinea sp.]